MVENIFGHCVAIDDICFNWIWRIMGGSAILGNVESEVKVITLPHTVRKC